MKIEIHKILCPTDFSVSAEHAFNYALAIAARHGATVELLHVTEGSAYANEESLDGEAPGETYEDRVRAQLRQIADTANTAVSIDTKLVSGIPYVEILSRATSLKADLIVIGTHGRTGMKQFLIGSVAEKVVRTSSCPVCTIRHPDHVVMGDESRSGDTSK